MIGMAAMLVVILIAAMILAFVLAAGERRREQKDPTSLVRVTQIVAVVWAGVSAVGALVTLLFILLSPTVSITMPIQSFWPELPSQVRAEPTEATRVSGGFDSVTLDVAGLNPAARITWAISQVAAWLVPASIAALVAVACSTSCLAADSLRWLRGWRRCRPCASLLAALLLRCSETSREAWRRRRYSR